MTDTRAHERAQTTEALTDAKESVIFLERTRAVEGADLQTLGLDPRWYVAAVPTELSFAGKVNRNGRIYRPSEFVSAHQMLNERAGNGYVSGLKGHPMRPNEQDGDREFDIAVRLMSVETYTDEAGVLRSRGVVAFPNTTLARDLYILWRGGLEIGTSSRARAMFVPHIVDESSPYWAQNPEYRGQRVVEAINWSLGRDGTYDLVLDPSASTFLDSAAREAVMHFETCNQLPKEEHMADPKTNDAAEQVEAPESTQATRDEIVKEAVEAYRAADPFAQFDEAVRKDLLAAHERAEGGIVAALEALEAAKTDLQAQLDAVTAERDALQAEKAKAERAAALESALESALDGYAMAVPVRKLVDKETFESVDDLQARVAFLKSVFDGVEYEATGKSRTATESVDDEGDNAEDSNAAGLTSILGNR